MRSTDMVVFGAIVVGFAIFATAHVAIAAGLARRAPRWRSVVGFVVAPMALYWAIRERMIARSVAWSVGAAIYIVARVLGLS